jgi:hypothetical protein
VQCAAAWDGANSKRRNLIMKVHKASLAVAAVIMPLAATQAAENIPEPPSGRTYQVRVPSPDQSLPSATSRPSNRNMRSVPSMGSRGIRGMSGGRMNGGMGRRR